MKTLNSSIIYINIRVYLFLFSRPVIKNKKVNIPFLIFQSKEWINCIRHGGTTSANIERAFEEGVTCLMAQKSYLEKRQVRWDPVNKKIV